MKSKCYLELLQSEIMCICSWLGKKSRDINNEHHGWELNNTWIIGNTTTNFVCRRHRAGSLAKGKFILAAEGLWGFLLGGRRSTEKGFVISSWAVETLPWLRCSSMCWDWKAVLFRTAHDSPELGQCMAYPSHLCRACSQKPSIHRNSCPRVECQLVTNLRLQTMGNQWS